MTATKTLDAVRKLSQRLTMQSQPDYQALDNNNRVFIYSLWTNHSILYSKKKVLFNNIQMLRRVLLLLCKKRIGLDITDIIILGKGPKKSKV